MIRILAWALFDLANTFFAVAMVSFYFPLWLMEDRGATELSFSFALAVSLGVVALLMPFCGALSDATDERMRYLRWTTYGCVIATALIGWTSHVPTALALFALANACYQLGTIFYDALLSRVAPPGATGQVSGIGACFGYLGSMLGLLLLWPFVQRGGSHAAFAPSAAFFLLFALPSFLLIREAPTGGRVPWRELLRTAALRLVMTLRAARSLGGLWRYLWAAFFSATAINTVLVFMAVYTRKVLGFTQEEIIRFFLLSQAFSVAGALVFSRLIQHWGARRTLIRIWCGWAGALGLVAIGPSGGWLWVAGPVIGFCLGSTWATSRVLILELAPKDQLAEMFGLAGLFSRAASIVGSLIWGAIVLDPARYQLAVVAMIGLLAIGIWLLHGVREPAAGAAG